MLRVYIFLENAKVIYVARGSKISAVTSHQRGVVRKSCPGLYGRETGPRRSICRKYHRQNGVTPTFYLYTAFFSVRHYKTVLIISITLFAQRFSKKKKCRNFIHFIYKLSRVYALLNARNVGKIQKARREASKELKRKRDEA